MEYISIYDKLNRYLINNISRIVTEYTINNSIYMVYVNYNGSVQIDGLYKNRTNAIRLIQDNLWNATDEKKRNLHNAIIDKGIYIDEKMRGENVYRVVKCDTETEINFPISP
jgi:hypothetical protein